MSFAVFCGVQTRKQNDTENPRCVLTFSRARVTDVPIFSLKVKAQDQGYTALCRWPHNMCCYAFLVRRK